MPDILDLLKACKLLFLKEYPIFTATPQLNK